MSCALSQLIGRLCAEQRLRRRRTSACIEPNPAYRAFASFRPDAGIQVYSITLWARIILDRQHARMPATNAKPRDEFAGLYKFATGRGVFSSRHRDACRPVAIGFCVALSGVSSIGLLRFAGSG